MASLTVSGLLPSLEAAVRERLAVPELDTVVASPGRQAAGRFLDLSREQWTQAVAGTRRALAAARSAAAEWQAAGRPGRVVFLVSPVSLRAVHGAALDATAGAFLTTIAQVGAVELGGGGITVNTVVHGWLEGEDAPELAQGVPAGRLTRPEDVAAAVEFVASRAGAYVNGAVLAVDGGFWITKASGGSPLLR